MSLSKSNVGIQTIVYIFKSVLFHYFSLAKKNSLKGKGQYSWPPCTNHFRSVPFYIDNIIYLFLQNTQSY